MEPHSRLVQKVTDAISTIHGKEAHTRAYPIDQLLQDESGSCSSGETHVVATYKFSVIPLYYIIHIIHILCISIYTL